MQTVTTPNPDDLERLDTQRSWVSGHLTEDSTRSFGDIETKLSVLQAILDNGWATAADTWQLQALGAVFGDVLAQLLKVPWVTVEDDYGRDAALLLADDPVLLFPLTMISRRIEAGETVDVMELLVQIVQGASPRVSRSRPGG